MEHTSVSRRSFWSVSSIMAASRGYELIRASLTKPPFEGFAAVAMHSVTISTARSLHVAHIKVDHGADANRKSARWRYMGAMHDYSSLYDLRAGPLIAQQRLM